MDSPMTTRPVEVITSVQRRRRWSLEEKRRLVAAAIEPGAVASEVARRAGIHVSQLFRWRREFCSPAGAVPAFSPVAVAAEPSASSLIEVEFSTGTRLRIAGAADRATVFAIIKALTRQAGRR